MFCAVRFVTASRQLVKNLEQHTLNEHGLSKRYVRCLQVITGFYRCIVYFSMLPHKSCLDFSTLYHYICMCILWFPYIHIYIRHTLIVICPCQISEVVNHMKDLIEFTNKNNLGPIGMIMHIYLSLSSVFT